MKPCVVILAVFAVTSSHPHFRPGNAKTQRSIGSTRDEPVNNTVANFTERHETSAVERDDPISTKQVSKNTLGRNNRNFTEKGTSDPATVEPIIAVTTELHVSRKSLETDKPDTLPTDIATRRSGWSSELNLNITALSKNAVSVDANAETEFSKIHRSENRTSKCDAILKLLRKMLAEVEYLNEIPETLSRIPEVDSFVKKMMTGPEIKELAKEHRVRALQSVDISLEKDRRPEDEAFPEIHKRPLMFPEIVHLPAIEQDLNDDDEVVTLPRVKNDSETQEILLRQIVTLLRDVLLTLRS